MVQRLITCAALVVIILAQGCTIHFKSKETELDVERQRVKKNTKYELEKIVLLDGEAGK